MLHPENAIVCCIPIFIKGALIFQEKSWKCKCYININYDIHCCFRCCFIHFSCNLKRYTSSPSLTISLHFRPNISPNNNNINVSQAFCFNALLSQRNGIIFCIYQNTLYDLNIFVFCKCLVCDRLVYPSFSTKHLSFTKPKLQSINFFAYCCSMRECWSLCICGVQSFFSFSHIAVCEHYTDFSLSRMHNAINIINLL